MYCMFVWSSGALAAYKDLELRDFNGQDGNALLQPSTDASLSAPAAFQHVSARGSKYRVAVKEFCFSYHNRDVCIYIYGE